MILVDSNVLIDIIDRDSDWFDWSFTNIQRATADSTLFVNSVIVGEMAANFAVLDDFRTAMAALMISIEPVTAEAAFCAGTAFQRYRKRRDAGTAKSILADFLIGGHAQSVGASILTRDPRFYRSYFPGVPLITPAKDD